MVQTSDGDTVVPYAPAFESMCPPPKSRSGARAKDPEGNLAVKLPESSELAPSEADEATQAEAEAEAQLDAPVEDEPEVDPIASGEVSWNDATAAQKERARSELQDRITFYLKRARSRVIVTDNLQTMLSIKRSRDGVLTFRLHHMFIGAPAVIVRAAANYAETHDRESARLLHAYVDENESLIRKPEQPRSIPLDTEGRYHNLQEIFDELNEQYFEGEIEARITWGRRSKRARSREKIDLGQYVFDDKLIRIHPVLDAEDVPRFFVESVVYHEMLHEKHGPALVDGRREDHPPAFRRDEAKFEHHKEAMLWEWHNAHLLLER